MIHYVTGPLCIHILYNTKPEQTRTIEWRNDLQTPAEL